jgi:cysteine dioxygenase
MEAITTVKSLIEEFKKSSKKDQPKIVKRIQLDKEDVISYATWSDTDYTRNCLARTDEFEFILLCWDEEARTPIHGHGGQDCWVYQVEGTVEELRFEENESGELVKTQSLKLESGGVSYMNDKMGYHLIKNTHKQKAMTLHIYAKPIDACKVFDTKKEEFKMAEMEYDSIAKSV